MAWRREGKPLYALEGSVFMGGATMQWLRDEMKFVTHVSESEKIAESIADTGGVYLVPAFTGLGAPWWDMYSRGTLVGMTRGTGRAQIVRAALEAIADRAIERKIGARGLRSIMESVMTDIMYTVPSDPGILKVIITEDSVRENGQPVILRTKDLAG